MDEHELWAKSIEEREIVYKTIFRNYNIYNPESLEKSFRRVTLIKYDASVIEVPPSPENPYWTYVTSGLSNPIFGEKENSGLGVEYLICTQGEFPPAIDFLFAIMEQLFIIPEVYQEGERVHLDPIPNSLIKLGLFWTPEHIPNSFNLSSGNVKFLQIHGVTEEEDQFYIQDVAGKNLYQLLKTLPTFPAIDLERPSLKSVSVHFEKAVEERTNAYKRIFKCGQIDMYLPKDPGNHAGGEMLRQSGAKVYGIPPSKVNPYWTYVTSGLSDPTDNEARENSGLGVEYLICTREESPATIMLLFDIMGFVFDRKGIYREGDRMALSGTDTTLILFFWPPDHIASSFHLISGNVKLLQIHSVTEEEHQAFAENEDLYRRIRTIPDYNIFSPYR